MSFSQIFTDILTELDTIEIDNPVQNPQAAKNFQKTQSNLNLVFKTRGIWNDQIDDEIQSAKLGEKALVKGFIIKCPAVFVEFVPNDGNQILGCVTQYPEACIYFHLFSDELNTPNAANSRGDLMDSNFSIYDLRDTITSRFLGFHTHNSSAMMSRYDKLDYKHGTITKYLRGFTFCFNDDRGSIFDSKSSRYLIPTQINATLGLVENIEDWKSGSDYLAFNSVVKVSEITGVQSGVYLCIVSNSSALFTPSEWAYVPFWVASTSYLIGDYIFINNYIWQCNTDNSDLIFNGDNWNLITRI